MQGPENKLETIKIVTTFFFKWSCINTIIQKGTAMKQHKKTAHGLGKGVPIHLAELSCSFIV